MSIVQSLLDIDYYKLTMAQLAFHRHPAVPVRFGFLNRTSEVCLPEFVDEDQLRAELDHVRSLRFTSDELDFLRESPHVPRGLFSEEFLAFLAGLRLPDFELARESSTYKIEVEASWPEVTCWETLSLCVVTELYGRALMDRHGVSNEEAWAEGERRLARKIELVRGEPRVRFSDFGTRRRFSLGWQRRVIETLA
ncbi:MAG: nicotinate phosphoribosyltransferase, partial [Dehalococcoidia bacterium]|nr:nicotinate phosphoribosyltransferase [Dehalococcoidia bacterium]